MFNLLPVNVLSGVRIEHLLSDNTMYVIEDGMLVRIENAIKPNMDNAYYNLNTYHPGDAELIELFKNQIIKTERLITNNPEDNLLKPESMRR